MFVEIGLQGKGFITSFAIKVLESRMGLHVSTKIGPDQERLQIKDKQNRSPPVSKGFPTVSTAVGFISGVRSHMAL